MFLISLPDGFVRVDETDGTFNSRSLSRYRSSRQRFRNVKEHKMKKVSKGTKDLNVPLKLYREVLE